MLSGVYPITFAVSGVGTLGSTSGIYIGTGNPNATASVANTVSSEQGQNGSMTVTASSGTLTPGTVTVKSVTVGAPVSIGLAPASGDTTTFSADTGTDTLQTSIMDSNGNPTSLPANDYLNVTVTENGNSVTGFATYSPSTGTIALAGHSAGTYTVTVSDADNLLKSASTTVTVTPGAAAGVSLATSSVEIPVINPTVTVTAQLQDKWGNDISASGVGVTLQSMVSTVPNGQTPMSSLNNGPLSASAVTSTANTNASGVATFTFKATESLGAVYKVSALDVSGTAVTEASSAIPAETITEEQSTVASMQLSFFNTATSQPTSYAVAGTDVTAYVYAFNQYGGPATPPTGSSTGDTISVTIPAGFTYVGNGTPPVNGVLTTSLNSVGQVAIPLKTAQSGTATLSASDSTVSPAITTSATMQVATGNEAGVELFQNGSVISNPITVTANTPVAFTVEAVDAGGNPVLATQPTTVNLSDGTATGYGSFRTSLSGASLTQVVIPAGQSAVQVYYVNGNPPASVNGAGNITLTGTVVDADAVSIPTPSVTVVPGSTTPVTAYVYTGTQSAMQNATVMFTLPSTSSGTFAGGQRTVSVVTNASGFATVSYVAPSAAATDVISVTANNVDGTVVPVKTVTVTTN